MSSPGLGTPVLEAVGVVREYHGRRRSLRGPRPVVRALDGVDLRVTAGETLGIVGESGSGKSTLARLLLALDRPDEGSVRYDGRVVSGLPERSLVEFRRDVQIVLQDPNSSLNPRMRVYDLVAEPLRGLRVGGDHRARVAELLEAVGMPAGAAERYPHEFSGGQRQRIAIARALAPHPRVLVGDEPVSALDVSVRAQILNLLRDLVERFQLTFVLVSHDLSVVRYLCDRVVVMEGGRIVEGGPTEQVYSSPAAPYTQRLLATIPTLEGDLLERMPTGGSEETDR
jgi:ABC-type glutathione transport system ATPase component